MSREDFDEIMNLQRQMASRVVQENEMELQLKLLEIINSLVKDKNNQISKAQVLAAAELEGINDTEAARLLKTLEDLSYVKRAGPSHYRIA